MIELTLAIITLALEAFNVCHSLVYINVLIRIIEVVTLLPKIISYVGVTKLTELHST
ncbi:hypothetical protein ACFFU1_17190 [Algibacter miyuki]|uniref:Uncharacterized protein n=1 Tax=Algibacter miyuki TaxID=1306933 RepID=A0ABV5H5B7_9FLAO|nr:hypothetical protein [Algibacter miyuki]MDN3665714.1 hypothetical protein [Algibacter miyuki]